MRAILSILFFCSLCASGQKKGDNAMVVKGVSLNESVHALLDAGFVLEKTDSNFQTITTDFKDGTGKNKWMKYRLHIRIKDSKAIIKGDWYNTLFIGNKVFGQEQTIENNVSKIENTSGNPKNCFNEMKQFALSFNKPVEYKKE